MLNETDIWVVRKGYLQATEGRIYGFTAEGRGSGGTGHRFGVDRGGGDFKYENLGLFGMKSA